METNNAGYADLALGFVGGLNDIGPLIPAVAPDVKLSVRIILEDKGREARIDLGSRPPVVEFGEKTPPADITMHIKAKDFHDLLRGKLGIMKGWNEKKILLELTPDAFSNMPDSGQAASEPVQVPGFVYELYLTSIGAKGILEGPDAEDREISLAPRQKGFFEKIALGIAWSFGTLFGLLLRLIQRRIRRAKESDEPAKIEIVAIEKVPEPGKPVELPRPIRAVMAWFFDRVDMFKLARSFVGGARVTASL